MELDEFLHPRVIAVSATKFQDGHFQDAAFAAVKEVEEALREALGDSSAFGRRAAQKIVSSNGVSLRFPYSRVRTNEKDVHAYFDALFGYHRNALAHENVELSRAECIRILAAASELMAMLGASVRSYAHVGGAAGLVKEKIFDTPECVAAFLLFLHHQQPIIDDTNDGFFEDLVLSGYSQEQLDAVMDLGLVESERSFGPEDFVLQDRAHVGVVDVSFDIFKLTALGVAAVKEIDPTARIRGADADLPEDA